MLQAVWRKGFGFYDADAQKVAEEIMSIGDSATPQQIVDAARDENSELHRCFTWDDTEAADKWRLQEARQITYHLVIKDDRPEMEDKPATRFFYKTTEDDGYKPTSTIFKNMEEHAALLQRAYAELAAFKRKYGHLQELSEILALID